LTIPVTLRGQEMTLARLVTWKRTVPRDEARPSLSYADTIGDSPLGTAGGFWSVTPPARSVRGQHIRRADQIWWQRNGDRVIAPG
jgi:hypothetical protein